MSQNQLVYTPDSGITETPQGFLGSRENRGQNNNGARSRMQKKSREQGADKINLGSTEHGVCHKIMLFYTREIFRFASIGIIIQKYTNGTCTL